jgi:hypothetical protein
MPSKVTVFSNGPIRIEGEFEIVDPDGNSFGLAGRTTIGLCRCGHAHKTSGFTDAVVARELPPPKPKV